jgi:broad specificity phosphatase PhoE
MQLVLVRHGESEANVAAAAAEAAGAGSIDVPARDPDVHLSDLGRRQSSALGPLLATWVAAGARIWTSPYVRAVETATEAATAAGVAPAMVADVRLRDRELGILDALTARGVEARFPEEAARRRWLGKYYYRPPGGESWADVSSRLRDALRDIAPGDRPTVVVTHDAVVLLLVALLLRWDEASLLEFARTHNVGNASVTRLDIDGGAWRLVEFAGTGHLDAVGVVATEHAGDQDARIH